MPKEFSRCERVADYLMRELARLLQQELRDPRIGMVSVNDVEVSRDMAHAKVFVTFMDAADEADVQARIEVLNGAAGFLRSQVAREARMRTTPRLKFHFDASVNRGRYLSSLIDKAVAEDESRHGETDPEGH